MRRDLCFSTYANDIVYLLHSIKHVLPWYARTSPESTQALSSKYAKCARIMISDVLLKLGRGFILNVIFSNNLSGLSLMCYRNYFFQNFVSNGPESKNIGCPILFPNSPSFSWPTPNFHCANSNDLQLYHSMQNGTDRQTLSSSKEKY